MPQESVADLLEQAGQPLFERQNTTFVVSLLRYGEIPGIGLGDSLISNDTAAEEQRIRVINGATQFLRKSRGEKATTVPDSLSVHKGTVLVFGSIARLQQVRVKVRGGLISIVSDQAQTVAWEQAMLKHSP